MSCSKAAKLACKYGIPYIHYRVGNITNPDYTVVDHTPKKIDNHTLVISPCSPRNSELKLANMEIFNIIGNTLDIKQGDILAVDSSKIVSSAPSVTVYQWTAGAAITLGFKSDRVGDIRNGQTVIYSNIKFAFLPSSDYAGKPLNRELQDSLSIPSIEVITFPKQLYEDNQDAEGLLLVQTDVTPNITWLISNVVQYGTYAQVLTLKRNW